MHSDEDLRSKSRDTAVFLTLMVVLLIVYGFVCLYSASGHYCSLNGQSSIQICLNQLSFLAIALAGFFFIRLVSENFLKMASLVLVMLSLVLWTVFALNGTNPVGQDFLLLLVTLLSSVLFLSAYMAKRGNAETGVSSVFLPGFISMCQVFAIVLSNKLSYALIYVVAYTLLLFLYGNGLLKSLGVAVASIIPSACFILASPTYLESILASLSGTVEESSLATDILNALASGSVAGVGIGMGVYKYAYPVAIFRSDILLNIAEEMGYAGFILAIVSMALVGSAGCLVSSRLRKTNLYWSNLSLGMTLVLVVWFILNTFQSLGMIPRVTESLPFFSYGSQIVFTMIMMAFIARANAIMAKSSDNDGNKQTDEKQVVDINEN